MNFSENKKYAHRISNALQFLKKQKISQKNVAEAINYSSLSKSKNPEKYPQIIIEKRTRQEVFEDINKHYNLEYNEITDEVIMHGKLENSILIRETMHYIMYYYSFFRKKVGMAWVRVINKNKVLIDYRIDEHWKGSFEVIESYTFITAEKQGVSTPVKKLVCLYSGTVKFGRPILLGTYATVKRDGFPAAGKVLFQKCPDQNAVLETFANEADERIEQYLQGTVFTSEILTPNSLEDLKNI